MAELESGAPQAPPAPTGPARSKDEIALELTKFIAVTTGYGKTGPGHGTGFSGKPATRSPEEQAEAIVQLFQRCREVVNG